MQSALARQPARRWLRWGRVLAFGVMLAVLQSLLWTQAIPLELWATNGLAFVAISTFFYLLISALEGFLTSRQDEEVSSGVRMGCLVGGISILIFAIAAVVFIVLASTVLPERCPPDCPGWGFDPYLSPEGASIMAVGFITGEGIWGIFGGLLGGWIGGITGQSVVTRYTRSRSPAIPARARWRKWVRVLLLGVVQTLAIGLLWLLFLPGWFTARSSWLWLFPLCALFYLLIPGVEGFLTARQNGDGRTGMDGGCLVGVVSILAFTVTTAVLFLLTIPVPSCPPTCSPIANTGDNGLLAGLALTAVVLHTMGCVFGGLLGGRIGGLLGKRSTPATRRSRGSEAAPAP